MIGIVENNCDFEKHSTGKKLLSLGFHLENKARENAAQKIRKEKQKKSGRKEEMNREREKQPKQIK